MIKIISRCLYVHEVCNRSSYPVRCVNNLFLKFNIKRTMSGSDQGYPFNNMEPAFPQGYTNQQHMQQSPQQYQPNIRPMAPQNQRSHMSSPPSQHGNYNQHHGSPMGSSPYQQTQQLGNREYHNQSYQDSFGRNDNQQRGRRGVGQSSEKRDRSHSGNRGNNDWQRGQRADYNRSDSSTSPTKSPYKRRDDDNTVFLSKTLSSILRHNAERFGFTLMKGGFLYVDDILHKTQKLRGYRVQDVLNVVEDNDKKRFALQKDEKGRLMIRANQGHSIEVDDLDLTPVTSANDVPAVIHGTYYESWELIKTTGLKRMNRNHIHFAAGEPGQNEVISGMRKTCQVTIYIDLEKALNAGLKFFRSANNVILSPGDKDGYIYPCFFMGARDRYNNYQLTFDSTISTAPIIKRTPEKHQEESHQIPDNLSKSKLRKLKRKEGKLKQEGEKSQSKTNEEAPSDEIRSPSAKRQATDRETDFEDHTPSGATGTQADSSKEAGYKRGNSDAVEESIGWNELILVDDVHKSKSVVEYIITRQPSCVVVCCCGDALGSAESCIRLLIILVDPDIYVYQLGDKENDYFKEGELEKVLKSRDIKKVFHNIGEVSPSLIREYDILLDGTPIFDIAFMYEKLKPQLSGIAKDELNEAGVTSNLFKSWSIENIGLGNKLCSDVGDKEVQQTLIERGKLMLLVYKACTEHPNDSLMKKLKTETYEAAIPVGLEFLTAKIQELKLSKKKEKKKVETDSKQKSPEKPAGGGQQKNKKKNKKK